MQNNKVKHSLRLLVLGLGLLNGLAAYAQGASVVLHSVWNLSGS